MTICDIFDAALYADMEKLKQYYTGDINCVNEFTKLNLLQTVLCESEKYEERLEIISFLIKEGINVNYIDGKDKYNALHCLYYKTQFGDGVLDGKYVLDVTKMLLGKDLDINARDTYGAISLYYLLVGRLENDDVKPVLKLLLDRGVDYLGKDNYGNSCLDYAKKRSKREEIVKMLEERK